MSRSPVVMRTNFSLICSSNRDTAAITIVYEHLALCLIYYIYCARLILLVSEILLKANVTKSMAHRLKGTVHCNSVVSIRTAYPPGTLTSFQFFHSCLSSSLVTHGLYSFL